jgi:hypothetical protein
MSVNHRVHWPSLILVALAASVLLAACHTSTPPPAPTAVPTATPRAIATLQASPTAVPTATSEPTATPTPEPPTASPSPTALVIQVEPTLTPRPGDDERISVRDLPLGQPGKTVNVTFGYQLQYPSTWYTGFGNRPLLISFSNLDPGAHNRDSMRTEGCLIQVNASPNIYGFTLLELRAQMPRGFPNAEYFDLDGESALLVRRSIEESPFESEWVYVEHADHLFLVTLEYAKDAGEVCLPAWRNMLDTWRWFEPEFAVYRNTNYGYAISYPRPWYRFNPREQGISISSQDPTGLTDLAGFLKGAMLVETDVFENSDDLPLKEWLAEQDWEVDLTNDIPLNGLIGVRVLREGPSAEIQEMSGYFQGPLGKIYGVTCRYPADRQWEFRPLANAIIYSFSF